MMRSERRQRPSGTRRNKRGSSIAETGPALFILFLMLFFPLVNLVTMTFAYFSCTTLNDLQLREAALLPKKDAQDPAGAVMKRIPEEWKAEGIGAFAGLNKPQVTIVDYVTQSKDKDGREEAVVRVTTQVQLRPFLTIPFFPGVPGLGKPMDFQITSQRPVENFSNAK